MVWTRLSVDPKNPTDPFRWPRALRITLRAYGRSGTLERPIEQTILYTFR
jgi:hypothetical protein